MTSNTLELATKLFGNATAASIVYTSDDLKAAELELGKPKTSHQCCRSGCDTVTSAGGANPIAKIAEVVDAVDLINPGAPKNFAGGDIEDAKLTIGSRLPIGQAKCDPLIGVVD